MVGVAGIIGGAITAYQFALPRAQEVARIEVGTEFLEALSVAGFDTQSAGQALEEGDIDRTISEAISAEDVERRVSEAVAKEVDTRVAVAVAAALEEERARRAKEDAEVAVARSVVPPDGLFDTSTCIPISDLMGKDTAVLRAGMEFCAADGKPLVRIDRINPPKTGMAGGSINYTLGNAGGTNCAGNCTFYGTEVPDFNLERYAVENGHNVVLVRF